MKNEKIIKPGFIENHGVYIKIETEQKEKGLCLSLTGVVGPKSNGDAWGSCGQILDSLKDIDLYAKGWNAPMVVKLFDIWKKHHLNDMNPDCVHQKDWNIGEYIDVQTFTHVGTLHDDIEVLVKHGRATDEERELLALSDAVYHSLIIGDGTPYRADDIEKLLSANMLAKWKVENKMAGWTSPSQHPKGVLSKACDVCGYKYGSSWLFEEVPADVLKWLASLRDAETTPAWV